MSAKLIYKDIAVGAAEDARVSASEEGNISKTSQTVEDIELMPAWATFEHNRFALDGSMSLIPADLSGQNTGYWSESMSGDDMTFSASPTLTIEFDNNYTALGVSFRFATDSFDFPTSLTLTWYQGATQLDRKTFYPGGASYFCQNTVKAFNKLVIAINSTNLPNRYARIEQIIFGAVREFGASEIGSVDILQEVNLISAEISINTLTWRLRNKSGVDYIFQAKQPVYAYNSGNLIGVYYIDDGVRQTADKVYEVPCIDAIGVLDGDNFSAVMYSGKNAVEALTEIVNGAFELDIDPSFSSVTLTGYIPDCTRRAALQQVAFAIGAAVDTSGSKKIKVFPVISSGASSVPASRVYEAGTVARDSIVTSVVVLYHTYTTGSGTTGDDVITVNGVKYIHTTGTVTVDNPNVTASDKKNVKTITDCTLINASNAEAVAARVYAYYARRDTLSSKIVVSDEQPGDYASVPTKYNGTITGNIESMKLKLSNTVAANVTVKAISS